MTGRIAKANNWLDAHSDAKTSLNTFSNFMTHTDVNADRDYKLVILDLGTDSRNAKLKVYKATKLASEINIINLPSGLVSIYVGNSEPRIPVLAVASGAHVYIYKNLRPYYKFTLPSEDPCPAESEVWGQAKEAVEKVRAMGGEEAFSPDAFVEMLNSLRVNVGEECLMECSHQLLSLEPSQRAQFIKDNCVNALKKQSIVTCMTTIKKSRLEEDSPSCVVVGTEDKHIYILDPDAFTIIEDIRVRSVPAFLAASGLYDVDYQIFSACRNGCICVASWGAKVAECFISPESLVVGFVIVPPPAPKQNSANQASKDSSEGDMTSGATIVIGLSNQTIQSYSRQGIKKWEISLSYHIKTIIAVPLVHVGLTLVAVALSGGYVYFYHERVLVDVLKFDETVSALSFGKYGQEDNTLVAVTYNGYLHVKILKRTSCFGEEVTPDGIPVQLNKPKMSKFSIPKRTKEFIEQSTREQEKSSYIHQTFQKDLLYFRQLVNRKHQGGTLLALPASSTPQNSKLIKLDVQVEGIGPVLKIGLSLETQSSEAVKDIAVMFHWDPRIFSIEKPFVRVPFLVPKFQYHLATLVHNVSGSLATDKITVLVTEDTAELKSGKSNKSPVAYKMDNISKTVNKRTIILSKDIDIPITEGEILLG